MFSSSFGTYLALVILGLFAAIFYYQGFMAMLLRRSVGLTGKPVQGNSAVLLGVGQLAGGAVFSALAILLFFSSLN